MGALKRIKNVEWEKNRRERLNLTFFELSRLLPDHDPTLTLTKLEILNKSIMYIKELQERNASLLGTNQSEVLGAEMTSLRDQVAELQRRNQQLAELLHAAKISLPPRPLPHSTPLVCPRKWAGKLSPNSVAGVKNVSEKKKGETKENPVNPVSLPKLSTKKKSVKMKKNLKTKVIKHSQTKISKSERSALNSSSNPLREFNNTLGAQSVSSKSESVVLNSSSAPLRELNSTSGIQIVSQSSQTNIKRTSASHSDVKGAAVPVPSKSVQNPSVASVPVGSTSVQSTLVLSRTVTLPCTTISLVLSNSKASIVTVAKSNVLPAPIMATGIQPVLQCNPSLSSLGPGTLIMPGGRIVPVPPPPTVLAPTLILLPNTTTTIAVTTTRPYQKPTSSLRPIVPKPRQRDITKTTFANKVPIPAISTYRQGLCSDPKPPHNILHVPLDTEKKLKKKSVLSKQSVREKCSSTESTICKSLIDISAEKNLESHSNKIDTGKSISDNKGSDKMNALKKSKQLGQCVLKRKFETNNVNHQDKGPKIAKIDANSVKNLATCADSNISHQECNRFVNVPTLQECPTDTDSIDKLESRKGSENVSKQEELQRNEKCNIIQENKNPSVVENFAVTESVPSNTRTAVGNQNSLEKRNFISIRKTDVITTTEGINCDNSVFCSSEKTSQNTVVNQNEKAVEQNLCIKNNPKGNTQISTEGDNHTVNSGAHMIKPSSCLIADTTLSTEGINFSNVSQQIPQNHVDDHSVNGEKHCDLIKTAPIDVSNIQKDSNKESIHKDNNIHKDNICINKSAQNKNDNIVLSTNNQQIPNLKDNTKQKSENLAVNDVYFKDKSQQVVTTNFSICSSTNKVVDSSTQVGLNFGAKSNQKDEVFNQNSHTSRLHFNNADSLFSKASINVNSIQKGQIQVLNINQNKNKNESGNQNPVGDCFNRDNSDLDIHFNNTRQISNVDSSNIPGSKNQILPDDRLHLGVKGNLVSQSDYKDNKSKNNTMSAVRAFSDETGNILNINCGGNERCQNPSTQSNIFSSSDQKNLSVNVYTNERKESPNNAQYKGNKGPSSNLKTAPCANNVQDPLNLGNNSFNSQQTPHHSCLDIVPSKNNSNSYSERFHFNESIQQSVSNKTVSVSTNETNISFNFQNVNTNNNMKVVSDINVQTNSSGNFYTNGNNQKQQNENITVLGNKLQNTVPVSGNFNFMKTHPRSDTNTSSKINVSNSSTNHVHFINTQKQNPLTNNSLTPNSVSQNVTDRTFIVSDQSKHITKTINSNSNAQGLNSGISLTGSNQLHVNISVNVSKNTNCQNQQDIAKDSDLSSKFHPETIKTSVSQSCKSTQVTSLQLSFADGEKHIVESKQQAKQNTVNSGLKKPVDELKPICDNKSLVQDDSQELTSLFPTEKLQSCSESLFRDTCAEFRDRNLFMPVSHSYMDEMRLNLPHSDFSNDLLSSLQVPSSGQHPESISPTAAFLLAFPLVSTSKTSEMITENDGGESQHATPTTILQIGNIEPSSSELFHQTALMMENNPNMMKQSKHTDTRKDNSSKQLKDIENFNKFQQIEINELMRNENFSLNNCKEKKNFAALGEQDIFYPCTKKKSNGKTSSYPMPSTIVPHIQNKAFEFSESNLRSNPEQDRQLNHNEKKNQVQTENGTSSQNIYNSSSQPYSYSSFPSGNEFMMPSSNYLSTNNQPGTESSKSISLPSSNFNVISWTTASITSNASQLDYTTPYCSYPQKPYSNTNQIKIQKNLQTNFEEQKVKDKTISNLNPLPKFANFQFNNSHSNQDLHGYPHSTQTDITNYKPESKTKKLKTGPQRAPVNWMTAPDVRPLLPDAGVAPVLPDVMFQHQKELDFPSAPNNMMMLNNSSNITPFNISTSTSNNSQTFYPNSHFSGVDLQLDFAPFPDMSTSKPLRNSTNVTNSQQNPHHYSWSPSKSSIPLMPHIDSHMIPSTLPTLVGDLALGTTTPSGPVDTFRNLSMPTTPFNIETPVKKYEKKHESQKPAAKINEKDCFPIPERRNNRTVPEYCQKTHTHQSTNTSSSFLSVSQLVDHVKTEQSPSSRRTTKPPGTKVSNNVQKRNTSNQQSDKSKVSSNINNHNNYHNSNPGMMGQRKFEAHSGVYQEVHNTGVGFPGTFANQGGPMPWQSEKPLRSTTHYKGSYSAESLIADQSTPAQGQVSELPQFPNQYNHPPVVSSASYPSTDFSHQNVQPLEFHQTHQNCFNFPSNSHYSSASFNPDSDYHLGLDHLFNFNPASNKHSTSCQSSTKDNRSSGKRGQNKQRREEFTPQWAPQVYPTSMRTKGPLPPHCPPSTSSPSHQGTTTLTNFNLSTIFPEINDKQAGMTGPPPPSNFPPAPNFRPH